MCQGTSAGTTSFTVARRVKIKKGCRCGAPLTTSRCEICDSRKTKRKERWTVVPPKACDSLAAARPKRMSRAFNSLLAVPQQSSGPMPSDRPCESNDYIHGAGMMVACNKCFQQVDYTKENGMPIIAESGPSLYAGYRCRGCIAQNAAEENFLNIESLTVEEWALLAEAVWSDLEAPPAGWVYCWSWTDGHMYLANLETKETRRTCREIQSTRPTC